MQIVLQFSGEDILLPMASQYPIQAMIYSLLSEEPDYAAFLHDSGFRSGAKNYRMFTFGPSAGHYERRGKQLLWPKGFHLEVRSCDPRFIQAVLQGTARARAYTLWGNALALDGVRLLDERVSADEICVRMLSPIAFSIALPGGATRYLSPEEDAFFSAVVENAADKWRAFHRREPSGALEVASLGSAHPKVVTTYKGEYITGYGGDLRLSGDAARLDFLYHIGLGGNNAQGFGMFRVLRVWAGEGQETVDGPSFPAVW